MRDWQTIDAALDTTAAVEVVGGDPDAAQLAMRLRDHGWRLACEHPRVSDGQLGWPPPDDELLVDIEPAAWDFVCRELGRWAASSRLLIASARTDPQQTRALERLDAVIARLGVGG